MEVLFENHHIRDKAMIKELYRRNYFTSPLFILTDILACIFIFIDVARIILTQSILLAGIIFPIFVFAYQIISYLLTCRVAVKRDLECNKGEYPECNLIVTDSYIQLNTSGGAVSQIEFSTIKQVMQTKHLILLRTKANLVYIFTKDGFTVGTLEGFTSFLKNKGVRIK